MKIDREARTAIYNKTLQLSQSLNDRLIERDAAERFERPLFKKLFQVEWERILASVLRNPTSLDELLTVLEALGAGCEDNGLLFSMSSHLWGGVLPLHEFGSKTQKSAWLAAAVGGEKILAHAMTEAAAGSAVMQITTSAQKTKTGFLLNGSKTLVTNAPVADGFLVYARDEGSVPISLTCFLIERSRAGLEILPNMSKSGLKTSPLSKLNFKNVEVQPEDILGRAGNGYMVFTECMKWERTLILAPHLGSMSRLIRRTLKEARKARPDGALIERANIQEAIAQMQIKYETARALLERASNELVQGSRVVLFSAMAKLALGESYRDIAQLALEVWGGKGYLTENGIEREVRDSLASLFYSGTRAIQYRIIAELLDGAHHVSL